MDENEVGNQVDGTKRRIPTPEEILGGPAKRIPTPDEILGPSVKKKEPSDTGVKESTPAFQSKSISASDSVLGSSLSAGTDLASGSVLGSIKPQEEVVTVKEMVKPFGGITPRILTQKSKSFLDRDVDISLNFSLKNPALTKTKDKYDLSAPPPSSQAPGLNMPFQDQVSVQKRQIMTDPSLLKEYGRTRLKQIEETANQFNSAADEASTEIMGSRMANIDNETSIALKNKAVELDQYKKEFRESLKTQAALSVTDKALKLGQQLDPIQIGREVLDVISDPTLKDDEKVLAELKNPSPVYATDPMGNNIEITPSYDLKAADKTRQNIQYNLYKTGTDAMKLYWSDVKENIFNQAPERIQTFTGLINEWINLPKKEQSNPVNPVNVQINSMKNEPVLQNYILANNEFSKADEMSANAITQFPQVERIDKIRKLNDAFFSLNEVKDYTTLSFSEPKKIWKLVFGATPSKEDVPELAKMTGLDEKEVKDIIDDGGFFRDIPYNVRVNGLLQGVARGAGETIDQTAMGIRRFFNPSSAETETQNRIQKDAMNEKGLMAQKNKLQDDAGKWNINPFSIANIMGYGMGQTSIQALPALVSGGLAAEGSLAQRAIEAVSTVVPGAAATYEDAYKTAASVTDDESIRKSYAFLNSLANGAAELLYSPADIVKGISGGPSKKAIFGAFMEDVSKKGLDKTVSSKVAEIGKKIWGTAKEPVNVLVSENIEEAATNLATNTLDEKMLGIKRTQAELADQAFSTFIQTTFQTLPLAIGVGIGGNNDMSGVRKQSLFEVGKQPDLFKSLAKDWLDQDRINQSQYNEKISQINQLQNIVAKLPSTDVNGNRFDYDRLAELAAQQFRIDTNEKKIKSGALAGEIPLIEADTKEAIKRQGEILNPPVSQESSAGVEEVKEEIVFPVRNNDFAQKYFSKESVEGQESEFDKWNRLKNENPKLASEMVQSKKDEILSIQEKQTKTEQTPSTPISKEGKDIGLGKEPMWKLTQEESFKANEDTDVGEGVDSFDQMTEKFLKGYDKGEKGLSIEGDSVVYRNENGDAVGFIHFDKDGARELGVAKSERGKGIASEMTDYLKKEKGIDKLLPPFSKEGNIVSHRNEVKKALESGKYQKAIEDGSLTKEKVTEIIESAGLKVPKEISKEGSGSVGVVKDTVYHGGKIEGEFNPERGDFGIHFGTKEQAENRLGVKNGGEVKPYTINLKNPIDLGFDMGWWNDLDKWKELGYIPEDYYGDIIPKLKSEGYDGVRYPNSVEGEGDSYIVFDKNAIKEIKNETTPTEEESNKLNLVSNEKQAGEISEPSKGESITTEKTDQNIGQSEESKNSETNKIKQNAERIIKGEAYIDRLSLEEERGRIEGGKRNVEASLIAGESQGTGTEVEQSERQQQDLEKYAKEEGIWYPDYKTKFGEEIDRGSEAHVYYDGSGDVVKAIDLYYAGSPKEMLDRISLANYVFPDSKMELIGFARNEDGKFITLVKQKYVESERKPTREEIKDELSKLGFDHVNRDNYQNDDYFLEDITPDNVIVDKDGNFHFIDARVSLNTKEFGGGERVIGRGILTKKEGGENVSPDKKRVASKIREGEEPIQAESIEGSRTEEIIPGGNVQTYEEEEIDQDYTDRENAVKAYASESGTELNDDEIDLAAGLIGEEDSVKDAVDFVIQDRINNSIQPLYNYISEIASNKIRKAEKKKMIDTYFDDIVTQLENNKKITKECK